MCLVTVAASLTVLCSLTAPMCHCELCQSWAAGCDAVTVWGQNTRAVPKRWHIYKLNCQSTIYTLRKTSKLFLSESDDTLQVS